MNLRFIAISPSGQILGELDDFMKIEFVPAYNVVRGWYVEMNPDGWQAEMMQQAGYLTAMIGTQAIWSGTVRKIGYEKASNTLTVSGLDELWLFNRLALPVPSGPPYTSADYDVRTGTAETRIKDYVYYNAGGGAIAARQISGLVNQTNYGLGSSGTSRARFDKLSDFICDIALTNGLGVRVINRQVQVWQPLDRSAMVRFSDSQDTLGDYEFGVGGPDANYLYGGGSGDLAAQAIYEQGDSSSILAYGRIEEFKSIGRASASAEISAALEAELQKQAATSWFNLDVIETPGRSFWTDVWVGDLVNVQARGLSFSARLAELTITVLADGSQEFKPLFVEAASFVLSRRSSDRLRLLEQSIRRLETK